MKQRRTWIDIMQLFKQIVIKNYQKYYDHHINNRFFPEYLANAISMSITVLDSEKNAEFKINKKLIAETNTIYKKFMLSPLRNINKIEDALNKKQDYLDRKAVIAVNLMDKLNKLSEYVYVFLKRYKEIEIVEDRRIKYYKKGTVAVIYPYYTYEKHN